MQNYITFTVKLIVSLSVWSTPANHCQQLLHTIISTHFYIPLSKITTATVPPPVAHQTTKYTATTNSKIFPQPDNLTITVKTPHIPAQNKSISQFLA